MHARWLSVRGRAFAAAVIAVMLPAGSALAAELPCLENFNGADGSPWPAPWHVGGHRILRPAERRDAARVPAARAGVCDVPQGELGMAAGWTVEAFDTEPLLQGTAGSFAADIYNFAGTNPVYLDDLLITSYPYATSVPVPEANLRLSAPHPHPVTGPAFMEIDARTATCARLCVYDMSGRLVAEPFAGSLAAGTHELSWNPVDAAGRRLAPGVYVMGLRAEAGADAQWDGTTSRSTIQRIVIIPAWRH